MILNTAKRFLNAELERIEANLKWVDDAYRPEIVDEYQRRYQIVCDLMDAAITPQDAVAAVAERLSKAQRLQPGITDPEQQAQLEVDIDYLTGIRERLNRNIVDNTYIYALADVDRL